MQNQYKFQQVFNIQSPYQQPQYSNQPQKSDIQFLNMESSPNAFQSQLMMGNQTIICQQYQPIILQQQQQDMFPKANPNPLFSNNNNSSNNMKFNNEKQGFKSYQQPKNCDIKPTAKRVGMKQIQQNEHFCSKIEIECHNSISEQVSQLIKLEKSHNSSCYDNISQKSSVSSQITSNTSKYQSEVSKAELHNYSQEIESQFQDQQHQISLFSEKILKKKNLDDNVDIYINQKMQDNLVKKYVKINDSKNIPKNYSRAIFKFIDKNQDQVQKILGNVPYKHVLPIVEKLKYSTNSIKNLRSLWDNQGELSQMNTVTKKIGKKQKQKMLQNQNKGVKFDEDTVKRTKKMIRIMSYRFLKQISIPYFYASKKVKNYSYILKYRQILLKMIMDPERFYALKVF